MLDKILKTRAKKPNKGASESRGENRKTKTYNRPMKYTIEKPSNQPAKNPSLLLTRLPSMTTPPLPTDNISAGICSSFQFHNSF